MNKELLREFQLQAGGSHYPSINPEMQARFAELIVKECCRALNPVLRDMISRGQGVDLIKQHFGIVEPKGWVCPKCKADRTKIACPLGFGATVDGRCPMTAEAQ